MLLVVLDINSARVATERRRSRFHSALFVNILSTRTVPGKGFMATPINAPMAGEIWHLSIEDLFQPVQESPRLGGDGPFVINLSVSTAPISVPTKAFTNSPLDAHVYQIQVTEDGRTRYRLRLGPFASEDEADAILAEVRDTYPGALTATASASDLRVIETMQAKADHRADGCRSRPISSSKNLCRRRSPRKSAPRGRARKPPAKAAPQKAAVAGKRRKPKRKLRKFRSTSRGRHPSWACRRARRCARRLRPRRPPCRNQERSAPVGSDPAAEAAMGLAGIGCSVANHAEAGGRPHRLRRSPERPPPRLHRNPLN